MNLVDYIHDIDDTVYVNIGKNKQIQPLDPLICIIKLAILSIKPDKTKISIHKNKISLQEPNFYQGVIRWTLGDQKNDIHSLYYPIRRAFELYYNVCLDSEKSENIINSDNIVSKEKNELNNIDISNYIDIYQTSLRDELKEIFCLSVKGISKLMSTYEDHPIITRCLTYYNCILKGQSPAITNNQEEEFYDNITYLFKNLWSRTEIHIAFLLLQSINKSSTIDTPFLIQSLESFLQPLERRFYRSLTIFTKTTNTI